MTRLVAQHDIDRPLIGVVVGQRGERAAQAGQGESGQFAPGATDVVVAVSDLLPTGFAVAGESVRGSKEQTFRPSRCRANFKVGFEGQASGGGEPAQATDAGFAARESDDAGFQVHQLLGEQAEILGAEGAAQGEPAYRPHPAVILDPQEGAAKLGRGVSLVAVGGAGGDFVGGGLAEVGAVPPGAGQKTGLTTSRRRPIGESFDVDHFSADGAGGDARQVFEGVGREFGGGDIVRGLLPARGLDKQADLVNRVVVGAPGELAGNAGGESLVQPSLVGVEKGIEGHGAGSDAGRRRRESFEFLADGGDSLGECFDGLRQGAGLADVPGLAVEGLVPTVTLGNQAAGGAELFFADAERFEPGRTLQDSSYAAVLRNDPFDRPQVRGVGGNWKGSRNTQEMGQNMGKINGEGEIRTPATLAGRPVFETEVGTSGKGLISSGIGGGAAPSYADFLRNAPPSPANHRRARRNGGGA